MLTYPSDSLPKIVCPMEEDVIPPNPVCSAPPHSEPPPPLLPFSYITPSCINDGLSGNRRSDRIQGIRGHTQKKEGCTDGRAAQKPSRQNLSPTKTQRERMVQVSQSKQLRVERTHVHENPHMDGDEVTFTRECQNGQTDPKIPQRKMDYTLDKNVVEPSEDETTPNLDAALPDMDTCGELPAAEDTENISTSKGWVIGPLFQSLKSKMASFTEIVMTPVKLFRANSPPPSMDPSDKLDDFELQVEAAAADEENVKRPDLGDMFSPGGQKENQDAKIYQQTISNIEDAQRAEIFPKCFKKLEFDDVSTQQSEQTAECTLNQKEEILPDLMPLPHRPLGYVDAQQVSFESTLSSSMHSAKASASHEFKLKTSRAVEVKQDEPLTQQKHPLRKHTRNRSELQKVDVRPLTSEVKKQLIYPEVNDEKLFSQHSLVKLNKIDLSETNKTLPLSTSVCYALPDADCHQPNDNNAFNVEDCRLVRQSLRNSLSNGANKTSQRPLDSSQMECQTNSEMCPVSSYVRAKRGMTINCHSQDSVKRTRVTAISQMDETKNQQVSDGEKSSRPRTPRKAFVLSSIANEGIIKPVEKRQIMSTRANRKGKGGQEMNATREEVIIDQTKSSSNGMLVCSKGKSSGVSHDHLKHSSSKAKPSGSCKRLKTRTALSNPHLNNDGTMDLETSLAVTSTKQAEEEPLSELLVHADLKQVHCTGKCRNTNKNSLKRKSPNHVSSVPETSSTLKSTSSVELMTTDFSASQQVQKLDNLTKGLSKPSKRPKNGLRGDDELLVSTKTQETKRCVIKLHLITKDGQSKNCKNKISVDPEYFESTPFVCAFQPAPSPAQPPMDSYVELIDEEKHVTDGEEKISPSMTDEIFLTDSDIRRNGSRSDTKQVGVKRRRADSQRRRCRVLHSRTRKGEKVTKSATMEDADLSASRSSSSENSSSRCLLRSYSCPEILSLHPHDSPWTSSLHSPQHSRTHSSHHHSLFHSHAHKSVRRARRHTVCSVEVERELAPLCLRKEVYPSRRSAPYDPVTQHSSGSNTHSPSTSLSALAACFLSSPLAFLSRKLDCRGAAESPSTSSCFPSSSSPTSPVSSSAWHSPGLIPKADSVDTLGSSSSRNPLPCDSERRQPSEEEDDGEDTSSSSHEFEDVGLTEEKALSDSEIKVVQKHEEQRKVSSIRIRRTLPKPQTNLTPMGLPKPIRVKKKEFTLEEIYTNKNYSKPPESRLESIFEVPLKRRDGSEAWFGQRRVKRFLEFLEGGEARKPKKPLVGMGKVGISGSRTRRGGFSKDGPSLSVQDVDSLLCSKLDQLNLWLVHDQKDR